MTEHVVSRPDDERAALILAKVYVTRNLVDGARWGLLDAMVEIKELEAALSKIILGATAPVVSGHETNVNDLAGEPDHTDYVPEGDGDRPW